MPVLYDSSIYINAMRRGGDWPLVLRRWAGETPISLSSVVMNELYAGASQPGNKLLAKMESDFEAAGRVLVPNFNDWVRAGKILAQISRKYGYERIGRARMTNDALIAVSAARTGTKVITANGQDFELLSEFCSLQWQEKPDFDS